MIKPNENHKNSGDLPFELLDKRKMIETFLKKQKLHTKENIELVNLGGDCPDDKLL